MKNWMFKSLLCMTVLTRCSSDESVDPQGSPTPNPTVTPKAESKPQAKMENPTTPTPATTTPPATPKIEAKAELPKVEAKAESPKVETTKPENLKTAPRPVEESKPTPKHQEISYVKSDAEHLSAAKKCSRNLHEELFKLLNIADYGPAGWELARHDICAMSNDELRFYTRQMVQGKTVRGGIYSTVYFMFRKHNSLRGEFDNVPDEDEALDAVADAWRAPRCPHRIHGTHDLYSFARVNALISPTKSIPEDARAIQDRVTKDFEGCMKAQNHGLTCSLVDAAGKANVELYWDKKFEASVQATRLRYEVTSSANLSTQALGPGHLLPNEPTLLTFKRDNILEGGDIHIDFYDDHTNEKTFTCFIRAGQSMEGIVQNKDTWIYKYPAR